MTTASSAGHPLATESPSRWSRRLVLAALAIVGGSIAGYLASYQFGLLHSVWEPLFDGGATRVLHSPVERLLPVPDAALGAAAYGAELVTDLIGGADRWRRRPWAVLLFGAVVALLALTAIALAWIQMFVLQSFCTLCLTSAVISLAVAALAVEEVLATVNWLRTETGLGRPLRDAVLEGERIGWWRPPDASRREPSQLQPARPRPESLNPPHDPLKGPNHMTYESQHPAGITSSNAGGEAGDRDAAVVAAHGSVTPDGASASTSQIPRPGGPDVDGGNERMWLEPDRSTWQKGRPGGVVVVTGAAAGLGRAIVREFAKHGYDVGLLARDEGSLENAKAEVEACGGRAVICTVDVSDAAAVDAAADTVERELGPIDVWVNDAMVSVFAPVKEMKPEEYKRVTDVNYLGYVYGTQAALKRMLPRDKGVVIHVGSALAYRAIPLQSAYCASKHAIQGFHESLRTELIHDRSHVRTTMVQMPALNTPQFDWVESKLPNKPQPVPPIYDPEVGAEAVYWAAHHERREVVVGITTWGAIQLNKLIPGMLDWYLGRTGYKSQQTSHPDDPNRPNDVREPVPGDHGAHGRFDARSVTTSSQVWATTHRGVVAGAVGAIGLLALGGIQAVTSMMRSNGRHG